MIHYKFKSSLVWHTVPITYQIPTVDFANFIKEKHKLKCVYVLTARDKIMPHTWLHVSTAVPHPSEVTTPFEMVDAPPLYDIDAEFGPDAYSTTPEYTCAGVFKGQPGFQTDDDFINDNTDLMILKGLLG